MMVLPSGLERGGNLRRSLFSLVLMVILASQVSLHSSLVSGQTIKVCDAIQIKTGDPIKVISPDPCAKYEKGWTVHFSWVAQWQAGCRDLPENLRGYKHLLAVGTSQKILEFEFPQSGPLSYPASFSYDWKVDEVGDWWWRIGITSASSDCHAGRAGAVQSTFRVFEVEKAGTIHVPFYITVRPGSTSTGNDLANGLRQMNEVLKEAGVEMELPSPGEDASPYNLKTVPNGYTFTGPSGQNYHFAPTTADADNDPTTKEVAGLGWENHPSDGGMVVDGASGQVWAHEFGHEVLGPDHGGPGNLMNPVAGEQHTQLTPEQKAEMRRAVVEKFSTTIDDPVIGLLHRCRDVDDPRGNVVEKVSGVGVAGFDQVDILHVYVCLFEEDSGFVGNNEPDLLRVTIWNPAQPNLLFGRPNLVYTVYIETDQNSDTGQPDGPFKGYDYALILRPPLIGIVGEPIPLQLIGLGASPTMREDPSLNGRVDEVFLHVTPAGLDPHENIPMGSFVEMSVPLSYLSIRLGNPLDVRATAEDSGSPTVTDVAPPVIISTGPRIITSTMQATSSISTSGSLTGLETSVQTFSSVLNSSTTSGTVTGVAGFPAESVALGLLFGFVTLVVLRRKRLRVS